MHPPPFPVSFTRQFAPFLQEAPLAAPRWLFVPWPPAAPRPHPLGDVCPGCRRCVDAGEQASAPAPCGYHRGLRRGFSAVPELLGPGKTGLTSACGLKASVGTSSAWRHLKMQLSRPPSLQSGRGGAVRLHPTGLTGHRTGPDSIQARGWSGDPRPSPGKGAESLVQGAGQGAGGGGGIWVDCTPGDLASSTATPSLGPRLAPSPPNSSFFAGIVPPGEASDLS